MNYLHMRLYLSGALKQALALYPTHTLQRP